MHFKLRLGNLDSGLKTKDKTVKHRNGFFLEQLQGSPDYKK
jgi:hypothetical protein